MAGCATSRETWAIGFALNARGATGIILAGVGREHGVIDDRLFVAMVVMALLTSLLSGPAIRGLLGLNVAARRDGGGAGRGLARPRRHQRATARGERGVERDRPAP
jgi:Kef-type K+ transport system membrane component KefB